MEKMITEIEQSKPMSNAVMYLYHLYVDGKLNKKDAEFFSEKFIETGITKRILLKVGK